MECLPFVIESAPTVQLKMEFSKSKFMAGEMLRAKVILYSSDEDTVIDSLKAVATGSGRTRWINLHNDKIFESDQMYMNTEILLCSHKPINAGIHLFPFELQIPEDALSSYESQYGTTRYQITLILESNTKKASCTEDFPFFVLSRSFLTNSPSNLLTSIDYTDEIDFSRCTPSGAVALKVHLPRTAFVLGETIHPLVRITNSTRKQLKECTLLFVLKMQFESCSRYEHVDERKLSEQVVDSARLGVIRPRSQADFDCCRLRIPEDVPPTQSCNYKGERSIISMHYVLRFTALPGVEFEIPLLVAAARDEKEKRNSRDHILP